MSADLMRTGSLLPTVMTKKQPPLVLRKLPLASNVADPLGMMNTTINDNTTKLASKEKLDNDVCPEVNTFHDSDDMQSFLEQHMLHSTDASPKQTFPMHKDSMPSFSEQLSFIILMLI